MRRLAIWSLLLGIAGPVLGLVLVLRPASAATVTPFARYALTVSGAGLTGAGTVDAGGGLVLTDPGTATISGRVDEAPSAEARAVATETGTTYRTLVAAEALPLPTPEAHAIYPGGDLTQSDTTVGAETATVTPTTAKGSATSEDGAVATEELTADVAQQTLSATASVSSGDVSVAGVLLIHSVLGQASITYSGGTSKPTASVSPISATVAGLPITIDSSGVHGVTDQVSAALSAAGISFSVLAPSTTVTRKGATADSGGVVVRIVQPDTGLLGAAGLSTGFDVSLLLGKVVVTESHSAALGFVSGLPSSGPSAASSPSPPASPATAAAPSVPSAAVVPPPTTIAQPPAVSVPVAPQQVTPPDVAAPATVPASFTVTIAGRRISRDAVLAGLGAWQLLTLGTTVGALLLSRPPEDEEEQLCPC